MKEEVKEETKSQIPPLIEFLDKNKGKENIFGSPLTHQEETSLGENVYSYEDGSILIFDPLNDEYRFFTQRGRELKESAEELVRNPQRLNQMKKIGEGGFSELFQFNTSLGEVAIKVTRRSMFWLREMAEKITKEEDFVTADQIIGRSGKKVIQKMSLIDCLGLFKRLNEDGILTPEFYGFIVRRNPKDDEIQEFQFMERINKPTISEIFEFLTREGKKPTQKEKEKKEFPYEGFLLELSNKYFAGNYSAFLKSLIESVKNLIESLRRRVPDIGDLEGDNIFLIGYDEKKKDFVFMIIDLIREEIIIKTKRKGSLQNLIPKERLKPEEKLKENNLPLFTKTNFYRLRKVI
ncbi:MAG: hypothetical protein ACPLKP_03225 [Microgenomates group bacterium]